MSDEIKELKKKLLSSKKNGYDLLKDGEREAMEDYCKAYMAYLDAGKTERLCAAESVRLAEEKGYRPYVRGMEIQSGDKLYVCNRGKAVMLAHIGETSLAEGAQIAAAHIDSPRLDLKPNPLYEEAELAFFKTHYYGGLRKYQWVTIPLELRGVIALRDGTTVKVDIGRDAGESQAGDHGPAAPPGAGAGQEASRLCHPRRDVEPAAGQPPHRDGGGQRPGEAGGDAAAA